MPWPLLALINIITSAIVVLLTRVLMKKEDSNPLASATIFQFGLGLMALIAAIALGRFALPDLTGHPFTIFLFIAAGFLWTGSTLFSFKAAQKIGASEFIVLGSSNAIITIILSTLFLGETLKLTTVFGTVLILFSIWLIYSEKLSFKSREGILLALVSAACAGIAVVVDARILRDYDAFSYLAIESFLPGIIMLCAFPKQIAKIPSLLKPKPLRFMALFCFIYTFQSASYYLAFQSGAPMSQLMPMSKSSIILTVILAVIFLGERTNLKKKSVAAILVTVGAILLG